MVLSLIRIAGCPIRRSPDQSLLTAPRGISVFAPSFIGSWRLGIPRVPLLAFPHTLVKMLPFTSHIQFSRCKPIIHTAKAGWIDGGAERSRTAGLLLARQALSQLSYSPISPNLLIQKDILVGLSGLEPLTSRLSGVRSNQLSYRPEARGMSISIPSKLKSVFDPSISFIFLTPLSLHRKEVIHPHLPVGIPCYDFTPIICPTFGGWLPKGLPHRLRVLQTLVV